MAPTTDCASRTASSAIEVSEGNVTKVSSRAESIQGDFRNEVTYEGKKGTKFATERPTLASDDELFELLESKAIVISADPPDDGPSFFESRPVRFRPGDPHRLVVHLSHATRRRRRRRPVVDRSVQGEALRRQPDADHVRRRRRHRRRRAGTRRDRRLLEEPRQVPPAGCGNPEGRTALGSSRDGQDLARASGGR